jgi:hypothetical protein
VTLTVDLARPQSDAPPTLPPGRRRRAARLLAELDARADGHGEARVTVPVLAAALNVAERTVQRASLDLVAAGLLEVIRPPGSPQRGVPNLYRLLASAGGELGLCHDVTRSCNTQAAGGGELS